MAKRFTLESDRFRAAITCRGTYDRNGGYLGMNSEPGKPGRWWLHDSRGDFSDHLLNAMTRAEAIEAAGIYLRKHGLRGQIQVLT